MAKIKLIKEDSILPPLRHMEWDVMVGSIPYYVVKIPGYVHTIGGKYGENDLWAYPRDKAPTYETLIEFDCDQPVACGIQYVPRNYIKEKWDETEAKSSGRAIITRNGEKFCHVGGDINYAIDKARIMITQFSEHPLDLESIDFDKKAIGRKVWWRSEPAIIARYVDTQACIILKPDGIDHFTIPAEFAEEDPNYYDDKEVKADILDRNIWWFRDCA